MGRISNYIQSNFFIIISSLFITNCLSLSLQKEDTSFEDDLVPATHVLPKQIFNEGKPFYVDKDPISGQLDFSSKKPAGIEPETNEVIDTQMKSVILNSLSPNIHDYLNLPVKYSSSKFVYPLVSSSYANLKYQGNNKNYMSHIKDASTSTTTSPKYYTLSRTTSETKFIPTKTSTFSTFSPTISTSRKTTTIAASTVQPAIIRNTSVPTKGSMTSTTVFSSTPLKTSTEKPTYKPTATLGTEKTTIKTTQKPEKTAATKKIITTLFKKLPPVHTTIPVKTSVHATIPLKTTAEPQLPTTTTTSSTTTTTTTTTPATTTTTSTTRPPTTLSTTPSSTLHTTVTRSTIRPTIGWEDYYDPDFYDNRPSPSKYPPLVVSSTERNYLATNEPSLFRPISSPTAFTTMNPAAVYNEIANKKDPNKMSLMDLFNALAEEDYSSGSGSSYGVEQSGNLRDNALPSMPAPFTLQKTTANIYSDNSTHSSQNSTGITSSTSLNTSYVPNAFNFPSSVNVPNIENVPHGSNFASDGNTPDNMGYSPSTDFPDDHKEYVRYEVQQPTVMQQYRPVPNTNNIVISPNQNSASFVVGSQQSVHHNNYMGSVDKVPLFESTDYMNEKTHSKASPLIGFETEHVHAPEYHTYQNKNWNEPQRFGSSSSSNINYNQEVDHELYDSAQIKFPNEEDQKSKIHSGLIQPEAFTQNQGNIVFPKNENSNEVNKNSAKIPDRIEKIVFSEEKPSIQQTSFAEPQETHKKEILTLNKYNLQKKVNIPTLPEDLTPPAPPESSDQKMRHHFYRPPLLQPQEPHLYHNDEFTRKKFVPPSLYRSKVDHSLPNILPQFRPNAKISHGHSVLTKEPGNIRITHNKMRYPHRSLPPPPPLPHSQYNRAPIGTHLNVKVTGNDDGNRRIFNVPVPSPPLHLQIVDRMYVKPPVINQLPPLSFNDNYHHPAPYSPRRHFHSKIESQKPQQPELTEKLYLEDDRIVNDSPKQEKENEVPQLEPVITLQMLKTQKKSPNSSKTNDNIPDSQKLGSEPPVYVVYPVKQSSQVDLLAVNENSSENFSKHPAEHNYPEHDYQNTPFSPLRDHHQEPVLMKVKDKSQSLNTFPYRLEKPDPKIDRYDDNHDVNDSDYGIDIRPRIVNSGFNRKQESYMNTEIPIAVAYTPTEPNVIHHNHNYSDDRYFDFQNHEQNYENDFMAPFFPSMSLGTVTNSPNSWSVYPGTTEGYDKNYINRADIAQNMRQGNYELSTKKFDPNQFQPELQGGFKPIYPPDYKIRNSDEESEEIVPVTESNSIISSTTTISLSSKATSPQILPTVSISTSSNSPEVTSITSTTSKPTERKKTKFEASLESLLFGDDEDFEDAEENSNKDS